MSRPRLTLEHAKKLDFQELSDAAYAMLTPYEAKSEETPEELDRRISRTLDELPDIYAWLLQLHAYCDHWTEWAANQFNMKSLEYKGWRIKRDLMENVARAAKLRYEGTSRRLTQIKDHDDEARMPRGRR